MEIIRHMKVRYYDMNTKALGPKVLKFTLIVNLHKNVMEYNMN
jgi:hypothetical protein